MKMESTGKYISRKFSDVGSALYRNLIFPFVKICVERKCDSIIGKGVYLNKITLATGQCLLTQVWVTAHISDPAPI